MKRIVIYHCFGGTHSSIIAANLHLGRLPWQNNVSASQLFSLPYFDQLDSKQAGLIYAHGTDEGGNLVCSLGRRGEAELAENILLSFSRLVEQEIMLVNALAPLGSVARVGGFLSRRWGAVGIGRILLAKDCLRVYPRFLELVGEARSKLGLPPVPKGGKPGLMTKL
ncbi:MAG: DUF3189 family protein [Firmicutes bacterium]|nr:DUF3189 family protein [Bacillota bacterium]HOB21741.1 DUF3189 family protein [Bacillota bacterium]HQD39281.1 DUF3189 family protein [Bacillota bacterium]